MKRMLLILFAISFLLLGFKSSMAFGENPFFVEWKTPYGTPPFDVIQPEHYLPAYERGMEEHMAEIKKIIKNPERPSFENTILAYDKAGDLLRKVSAVFGGLRGANTNAELNKIAQITTPKLSAHYNEIRMDQDLFARVKSVYDRRNQLNLDTEQMRVVEKYYQDFERGGAALPAEKREELKKISERTSMVSLQLNENLLKENNNFILVLENKNDLVGLPQNVISAAEELAKRHKLDGKWVIDLSKPSWTPFLQFSQRRDLREKIFTAYFKRGNNDNETDNKALFSELMQLRQQASKLLGFNNYAEFFISENMAETPQNVYDFMYAVWEPALKRAKEERDAMQRIVDREGGGFTLASWDWWYYAEKIRQEKYNLEDSEVRPYFAIDNVRDGCFYLTNQLWGLTYKRRDDIQVYHEEVEVFEVFDRDGSHLAVLYIDPHPRPTKRGGAWCGTYRSGRYKDGKKESPLVTIVMNFSRPVGDKPAMLSWEEVETYFHEFGHAIHNFCADGNYNRTSRSVPRDFVELPAQILENWAGHPDVLKKYALHYKTREPIPNQLVKKLKEAEHFNQGFLNVEYFSSAIIDLDWHTANHDQKIDVNDFEQATLRRIGIIDQIVPRHRTTNFSHIFGTGYAAGYYVYRWAGVLDADAYEAFVESGDLFNQELARKFRKYILAKNSLYEGMDAYKRFRGSKPSIEALLRQSGLL